MSHFCHHTTHQYSSIDNHRSAIFRSSSTSFWRDTLWRIECLSVAGSVPAKRKYFRNFSLEISVTLDCLSSKTCVMIFWLTSRQSFVNSLSILLPPLTDYFALKVSSTERRLGLNFWISRCEWNSQDASKELVAKYQSHHAICV